MTLFLVILLAGMTYGISRNIFGLDDPGAALAKEKYKNPYHPKEGGTFDHAARHIQMNSFQQGNQIGKQDYTNPLPFRVVNPGNDKLNEGNWGYAGNLRSVAVNIRGQERLLFEKLTLDEHPRLDLTRQDPSKGRKRRSQYTHVPSD